MSWNSQVLMKVLEKTWNFKIKVFKIKMYVFLACSLFVLIIECFNKAPTWRGGGSSKCKNVLIHNTSRSLKNHIWSWKSPGKVLKFCHRKSVGTLILLHVNHISRTIMTICFINNIQHTPLMQYCTYCCCT